MNHYTKTKEEKTAAMMERVLELLVYAPEPLELNKKEYKKINFSQGQVLNAIHEHSTPEEKIEGVVFNDASTISHNDLYKRLIRDAKEKRAKRLAEDSDLSFDGREPTVTELKIEVDRLLYEKESLAKTNKGLENIIKQAEIEETLEDDEGLVSEPVNIDKKIISTLEKLLVLNSDNDSIHIEKGKGQVPSQVFYNGYRGPTLLCNVNDLHVLDIEFNTDEHGKIIIVQKGILNV